MTRYVLFPSEVNGAISYVDCNLPAKSKIILLPGDVISVSSVRLPAKFWTKKKKLSFIINNLAEDILYDSKNDLIILLSRMDTEQGFFIVNHLIWKYWLHLRATLAPDMENAFLLPDWMLLPVPLGVSEGLSIQADERILYRRRRWQGASMPATPAHQRCVREMVHLGMAPLRNLQRFEESRHYPLIRKYVVPGKILGMINSSAAICLLLMLLFIQNGILIADGYTAWHRTKPEAQFDNQFLPTWLKLQRLSDTLPLSLTSVESHSRGFSVTLDSRVDCGQLMARAAQFFPQRKTDSRQQTNNGCIMTLTLPARDQK